MTYTLTPWTAYVHQFLNDMQPCFDTNVLHEMKITALFLTWCVLFPMILKNKIMEIHFLTLTQQTIITSSKDINPLHVFSLCFKQQPCSWQELMFFGGHMCSFTTYCTLRTASGWREVSWRYKLSQPLLTPFSTPWFWLSSLLKVTNIFNSIQRKSEVTRGTNSTTLYCHVMCKTLCNMLYFKERKFCAWFIDL